MLSSLFVIIGAALALAGLAGLAGLGSAGATTPSGKGKGHNPVTLCHAKPADTAKNGWVVITIDDDGVQGDKKVAGHATEHDADIIPAFTYSDGTQFGGKNLGDLGAFGYSGVTGQQVLDNDCQLPPPPTAQAAVTATGNCDGLVGDGTYRKIDISASGSDLKPGDYNVLVTDGVNTNASISATVGQDGKLSVSGTGETEENAFVAGHSYTWLLVDSNGDTVLKGTLTLKPGECKTPPAEVKPQPPTFREGTCDVPKGAFFIPPTTKDNPVVYKSGSEVLPAGTGYVSPLPGSIDITAYPSKDNVELTGQTKWHHDFVAPSNCPVSPPPTHHTSPPAQHTTPVNHTSTPSQSQAVVPPANNSTPSGFPAGETGDGLASTGSPNLRLVVLGSILVAAGGIALLVTRRRLQGARQS